MMGGNTTSMAPKCIKLKQEYDRAFFKDEDGCSIKSPAYLETFFFVCTM